MRQSGKGGEKPTIMLQKHKLKSKIPRSNDVRKVRCVGCDLHAALWKEDVVGCDTQNIASRLHIL